MIWWQKAMQSVFDIISIELIHNTYCYITTLFNLKNPIPPCYWHLILIFTKKTAYTKENCCSTIDSFQKSHSYPIAIEVKLVLFDNYTVGTVSKSTLKAFSIFSQTAILGDTTQIANLW